MNKFLFLFLRNRIKICFSFFYFENCWLRFSFHFMKNFEIDTEAVKLEVHRHCIYFTKENNSLVSLFNGILTFVGYLMPKPFFKKNSSGTI